MGLAAAEILMAAEMHLRPKKVRLVAVAILLPAEMHMRTEEVLLAGALFLISIFLMVIFPNGQSS